MRGFPSDLKTIEDSNRILFRVNMNSVSKVPTILVQSSITPDWTPLLIRKDYLFKDPLLKQFNFPEFLPNALFKYRLYANPTKKTQGKRVGLYKTEEHIEWLFRKGTLGGFKILKVDIVGSETITARVKNKFKTMTLQAVQFEGVLQVKDSKLFRESLEYGVGSGKAFGFGLLTISKI